MRTYLALSLALVAGASAQAQMVVDPGMSKAQVVAKLGKPLAERTHEGRTYLFYDNKMEKKVGMNDLVVLDGDKVVDAIFRAGDRRYSGTSSSPSAIPSEVAYYGVGKAPPPRKASPAPTSQNKQTTAPAAKAPPPPPRAAPAAKSTPANTKAAPTNTKAAPTTKKPDSATKKKTP